MGKRKVIFISYSIKDSQRLHVPELAAGLSEKPEIEEVHYWEGWDGYPDGNIVKFMEDNIENADFFIPICTADSIKSPNCEKERQMAIADNIHSIPLYEEFKLVSPALGIFKAISIKNKSSQMIVDEIYAQITAMLKSSKKRLKPRQKPTSIVEQEQVELKTQYSYFQQLGQKYEKGRELQKALSAYQEALNRCHKLYDSKLTLNMEKRLKRVKERIEKDEFEMHRLKVRMEVEGLIALAESASRKGDYSKATSLYEDGAKQALTAFLVKLHDKCKRAAEEARTKDASGFLRRLS